jgi:imidazolonepropionase-like amidohydrolase
VVEIGKNVNAIIGNLLIDGTGKEALRDGVVIIEGDKISEVGQMDEVTIPQGIKIIDGTDMTIMPGLVDAHLHLTGRRRGDTIRQYDTTLHVVRAISDAYNMLEHGVTAARCCGSPYTLSIKRGIEEGTIKGPRFVAAGSYISQTFGHGDIHHLPIEWVKEMRVIADGVNECRRAVRQQLRNGADFIKVMAGGGTSSQLDELAYPQFSPEELKAMVYEAHAVGKMVAAHAHGLKPIKHALACGVDSIEHGTAIDEESARIVAESNRYIVRNCYTPIKAYEETKGFTKMGDYNEWSFRRHKINYEHNKTTVKLCREMGCKQAIGPDVTGCEPYDGIPKNIKAFMELGGYSALEALSCCTKTGSEVLGLDDRIGTLEKGKLADIIVVDGNPLEDVMVLTPKENIRLVMKGGQPFVTRGIKLT